MWMITRRRTGLQEENSGPKHIVARKLQDLNIESRGPRIWKQGNEFLDLDEIDELKGYVGNEAVNTMWENWHRADSTSKAWRMVEMTHSAIQGKSSSGV